jgi:hypothetical protein
MGCGPFQTILMSDNTCYVYETRELMDSVEEWMGAASAWTCAHLCLLYARYLRRMAPTAPRSPVPSRTMLPGSGTGDAALTLVIAKVSSL